MSDEEIRIAIATQLGWKWDDQTVYAPPDSSRWARVGFNGDDELFRVLPDYPNDLNACAQFEKGLSHGQQLVYWNQIENVIWTPILVDYPDANDSEQNRKLTVLFSTAKQRCKAYLKTIGKWNQ